MRDDRGTGKTTSLFEQAVDLIAELPETSHVIITGPHMNFLHTLGRDFKNAGLSGVIIMSPEQIRDGACRGMNGVILIDDPWDLSDSQWLAVDEERNIMRR